MVMFVTKRAYGDIFLTFHFIQNLIKIAVLRMVNGMLKHENVVCCYK